ncbi:hypothetical protein [Marinicella litoralis]|uniref:Secreted protein n=1 Tax=Marinicella litoralis TaxID=644220 RepID=A0A4V3DIQ9_9GAMM|nr:hypothetical protein [Marinicella litoralis]TDR23161.1 hypothetical protein C8D91_0019 [Marinicella litoralis]
MKTNKLRNAIAPFLLTASAVVSAQMVSEAGVGGQAGTFNGGPAVLYDQTGAAPNGNGSPDQNFEAGFDAYDGFIADDFVVTDADGWLITQVNTVGTYSTTGPATSTNVSFHADAGGSPDPTPIAGCDFPAATILSDTGGSFVIDLGAGCVVPQGTAWISHQTNLDFGAGGQHFFSGTATISGSEGHFLNPGDGFGTGCTTFQPAGSVCGTGGGAAHDFLFSVSGSVAPPQGPPPLVPTLTWYGLGLMLLTFGFLGRRFIKND